MSNKIPLMAYYPLLSTAICTGTTSRDGTGGAPLALLYSPTASGSRIERITCNINGDFNIASANVIGRLYITDIGGSNPRLFREGFMSGVTPTASVSGGQYQWVFNGGLTIGTASEIRVGQSAYNANTQANFILEGSSFDVYNNTLLYTQVPRLNCVQIATASSRLNPNNLTEIWSAGINGSRIERIVVINNNNIGDGAIGAKALVLYLQSGTYSVILREFYQPNNIQPTNTVQGGICHISFQNGGLVMQGGQKLYCGMNIYSAPKDVVILNIEGYDY